MMSRRLKLTRSEAGIGVKWLRFGLWTEHYPNPDRPLGYRNRPNIAYSFQYPHLSNDYKFSVLKCRYLVSFTWILAPLSYRSKYLLHLVSFHSVFVIYTILNDFTYCLLLNMYVNIFIYIYISHFIWYSSLLAILWLYLICFGCSLMCRAGTGLLAMCLIGRQSCNSCLIFIIIVFILISNFVCFR